MLSDSKGLHHLLFYELGVSIIGEPGWTCLPGPWPRRAGCHTTWFEAARQGPVGLADRPEQYSGG